MKEAKEDKVIILIPTLEPDLSILSYVNKIRKFNISDIVIVNDGSSTTFDPIFKELALNGNIVLNHSKNLGKGNALKTGFNFISENYKHFDCIVMVDSDGQHDVEDVIRVSEIARRLPHSLTLGVRDFNEAQTPFKSLMGNRFASFIFSALYGKTLADTQTGLRAFGMPLTNFISNIKGERFEYEIQMLIECIKFDIPIETTPIKVIYNNDNEGSHYRPIADSIKILKALSSDFMRFFTSSFLSACVDLGIAWFLMDFLQKFNLSIFSRIFIATTIARAISTIFNYLINLNFVFKTKQISNKSFIRYLILAILVVILSSIGVYGLYTIFGLSEKLAKIITDTMLFILSYRVQQKWVFKNGSVLHS